MSCFFIYTRRFFNWLIHNLLLAGISGPVPWVCPFHGNACKYCVAVQDYGYTVKSLKYIIVYKLKQKRNKGTGYFRAIENITISSHLITRDNYAKNINGKENN